MTFPLTKSIQPANRESWETTPNASVSGGLNTSERPDSLKPNQVLDAFNVIVFKSELRADTGYAQLGSGANLDSVMMECKEFEDQVSGNTVLMGITLGSVYVYNTAHAEWDYVKGLHYATLDGAATTGTTNIKVLDSTGFAIGNKVGIFLTSGAQYRTTVSNVPDGTHITIPAAGLPSGASSGAHIYQAVALNGTNDKPVCSASIPGNNWFVFTNDVDYVKRYDGTDCVDVPGLTTTTCKSLALYNSALFLFNTTEGGTPHPFRARRSEIGDPTTWSGGTAGYDDLLDTEGGILNGDQLGPYLIVYKGRTIYRGQFVNSGGKYYEFNPMLYGDGAEGLLAIKGIVNAGNYHAIIGNANIYMYYGDFSLYPIGDEVFFNLFSADADVNTSRLIMSFGTFVEGLQELWFFYPSGASSSFPDTLLRYNIKTKAWTRRMFQDNLACATPFVTGSSFLWSSIVGSWLSQIWSWSSRIASGSNRPNIVLGPATGDQVFLYDFLSTADNGTVISSEIITRDFLWPGGKLRTDRLDMYIQGQNILIEYSTDQGTNWTVWDAVTMASMSRVQSWKQVVADSIRFRFSTTDSNFRMRWLALTWKEESVS